MVGLCAHGPLGGATSVGLCATNGPLRGAVWWACVPVGLSEEQFGVPVCPWASQRSSMVGLCACGPLGGVSPLCQQLCLHYPRRVTCLHPTLLYPVNHNVYFPFLDTDQ